MTCESKSKLLYHLVQAVDSSSSESHTLSSPRQTPSKGKRASITHRSKQQLHHSAGKHSTSGTPAKQKTGHSEESSTGLDQFPGGDAMLEVLTRLQSLQDSFQLQLQVITIILCPKLD